MGQVRGVISRVLLSGLFLAVSLGGILTSQELRAESSNTIGPVAPNLGAGDIGSGIENLTDKAGSSNSTGASPSFLSLSSSASAGVDGTAPAPNTSVLAINGSSSSEEGSTDKLPAPVRSLAITSFAPMSGTLDTVNSMAYANMTTSSLTSPVSLAFIAWGLTEPGIAAGNANSLQFANQSVGLRYDSHREYRDGNSADPKTRALIFQSYQDCIFAAMAGKRANAIGKKSTWVEAQSLCLGGDSNKREYGGSGVQSFKETSSKGFQLTDNRSMETRKLYTATLTAIFAAQIANGTLTKETVEALAKQQAKNNTISIVEIALNQFQELKPDGGLVPLTSEQKKEIEAKQAAFLELFGDIQFSIEGTKGLENDGSARNLMIRRIKPKKDRDVAFRELLAMRVRSFSELLALRCIEKAEGPISEPVVGGGAGASKALATPVGQKLWQDVSTKRYVPPQSFFDRLLDRNYATKPSPVNYRYSCDDFVNSGQFTSLNSLEQILKTGGQTEDSEVVGVIYGFISSITMAQVLENYGQVHFVLGKLIEASDNGGIFAIIKSLANDALAVDDLWREYREVHAGLSEIVKTFMVNEQNKVTGLGVGSPTGGGSGGMSGTAPR